MARILTNVSILSLDHDTMRFPRRRWRRWSIGLKCRNLVKTVQVRRFRGSSHLLNLFAKLAICLLQIAVLFSKPLNFAKLVRFPGEIERRRRHGDEETCNKQPGGEGQEERQDSFQHSFVQHAIHLMIAYINGYAAFLKSVSKIQPNSKLHSISFKFPRKAFSFQDVKINFINGPKIFQAGPKTPPGSRWQSTKQDAEWAVARCPRKKIRLQLLFQV